MGGQIPGGAAQEDGAAVDMGTHDEFLSRIGHMTRALHESLRGLGLDKLIEKAASDIPDARDRLDYVARLSEQAAQKVLTATEAAGPLQDQIDSEAAGLSQSWQALLGHYLEGGVTFVRNTMQLLEEKSFGHRAAANISATNH